LDRALDFHRRFPVPGNGSYHRARPESLANL
jgi:hypothetical protein